MLIKITPTPEKGDFIEYTSYAESKYFNPTFMDDIKERSDINIFENQYACYDGFIPTQRTKLSTLEIRFPRNFGVTKKDICFFAGSYTGEIDYIVESEINRAKIEITESGGHLTGRMKIESPLSRHFYGFAWNPPKR